MGRPLLAAPVLASLLLLPIPGMTATKAPQPVSRAALAAAVDQDPDLPDFANGTIDKTTYLRLRNANISLMRGLDSPDATARREAAALDMQATLKAMGPFVSTSSWSPTGPNPAPNGQTVNVTQPVSGRVTAIAIHPTNPNIVYLGTASGGFYRTLDGGATWTPLLDAALTMSIGAVAIDPIDPTTVFVGTGEGNLSLDSFMGVGIYRIRNADTAPIVEGPFETRVAGTGTPAGTGHAFLGNSINAIAIDPTNDNRIFVGSTWGFGGMSGDFPAVIQQTGLFFTETGMGVNPTFSLVAGIPGAGYPLATDVKFDPGNPNNLLLGWEEFYDGNTGIYLSQNATVASVAGNTFPAFVRTLNPGGSVNSKMTLSGTSVGMTVYAGIENGTGGTLYKSVNGGLTWANIAGANGFCDGQCWYDIGIATDPNNPNMLLVGGQAGNNTLFRSTNGGVSFANFPNGLHADVHAIAIAPSNPNVVYHGNDGGIFKSVDGGQSWASLNNAGLNTIQFIGGAAHPLDPAFWIGGSQDNGTHWYQPTATWTRADFGDGGFSAIDQNAPNNVNVTMYHTYFNAQNALVGYARVTTTANASDGLWTFLGNNANGISVAENPNFYAPLVAGPGSPNSVYYGTDRLHRSGDSGNTNPVVSQVMVSPISAIGIAPTNDNARLIGLDNGQLWGTTTGSAVLVNMTSGAMPVKYVGRVTFDPTSANIAYVAFNGFGVPAGQHVWKTTNFMSGAPVWVASGNGIPDVPVNSFAVDPQMVTSLYAGTDIGVYQSTDGGATWLPYTTGMPIVPVFGLTVQPISHVLRAATHGRGMWERQLPSNATATELASTASEIVNGAVVLNWYSGDGANQPVNLYRRPVPGDWSKLAQLTIAGNGVLKYTDPTVQAGSTYEYTVGMMNGAQETFYGQVWVTVPTVDLSAIRVSPNPARGDLAVEFALAAGASATVDLVDVSGRQVASRLVAGEASGTASVRFREGGIKPGMYWVRVTRGERSVSKRVAFVR